MDLFDPKHLIETFGTIGLILIVYAESGILIGLILPGDSLLFTAGLLASQNKFGLNIWFIAGGAFLAAVLGDQTGYWVGRRFGPSLFRRPDSRLFKQEYVERSKEFFEKHGPKTIVLARFVPIVRTLTPMLAGVGEMDRRTFTTYNVIGGALWGVGVSVAGYFLGKSIPSIDKYLLPIILLIVVISVLPPLLEVRKQRRASATGATPAPSESNPE
jgi:membrane-associated protein